jgi:hypothetical protein
MRLISKNAFEWRFEFPEVLDDDGNFKGFDVVIGNPPYITGSAFKSLHEYFYKAFVTAEYQLDLYPFFIELSSNLMMQKGFVALITPNSWLKNLKMSKLREFALMNFKLHSINPYISKAFSEAQVDTLILIAQKIYSEINKVHVLDFNLEFDLISKNTIEQDRFRKNENFILDVEVNDAMATIITKVRKLSCHLEDYFEITRGVNPYDKYRGQSADIILTRAFHSDFKKDETFLPELKGKHVSIFAYNWDGKHYISYGEWLAAPREVRFFKDKRLVFREIIGVRFICALIEEDFIIDRSLYIALPKHDKIDIWTILGILCSKLLIWIFRNEKNEFDDLFPKIRLDEFKKLPIPKKFVNTEIGKIAKKITVSKRKNLHTSNLEDQIDQLVYQLYDLTPEEIAIVEGSVK